MTLRSLLFVPGDSERKLARGLASGADALILDLEDAVAPARKPLAQGMVAEALAARAGKRAPELRVRINPLDGGGLDDLAAVVHAAPDGIMVPQGGRPGRRAAPEPLPGRAGAPGRGAPGHTHPAGRDRDRPRALRPRRLCQHAAAAVVWPDLGRRGPQHRAGRKHPLAECWALLESAYWMVLRAGWLYDAGKSCGAEANAAKLLAGRAAFQTATRAVMMHGGMVYAQEYQAERLIRESILTRIAPISEELVLSYLAERVLGLPKSY